jgi:hypothetical protein
MPVREPLPLRLPPEAAAQMTRTAGEDPDAGGAEGMGTRASAGRKPRRRER